MGYRYDIPPAPDPEDLLPVFDMFNNEVRTWSIPCFYLDVDKPIDWHDPACHDHHGWPRPDMPDHICQAPWEYHAGALSPDSFWQYVDMDKAVKIHLTSEYEGYNSFELVFDPIDENGDPYPVELFENYLHAEPSVRTDEDWIVDVIFKASLPPFVGKPQTFLFNLYASVDEGAEVVRKDLVVRGRLVVYPC